MKEFDIVENALMRKRNSLEKAYKNLFESIKNAVERQEETESSTFESNTINKLVEMNSIKMKIRMIDEELCYMEIISKE